VRILATNDDGIDAPGLWALVVALREVGEVVVVAPDHNWSAAGLTKTMHKPLRISEARFPDGSAAYTTNGAPSDCVALALLGILPQPPDLVVSGINSGANMANDILYSGTVAAAMEGVISGITSLAVSLDIFKSLQDAKGQGSRPEGPKGIPREGMGEEADFTYAAQFTARLVRQMGERGLPPGILLNVNVPCLPSSEITGVEITRLGRRLYKDALVERRDPRGHSYYWIGGERPGGITEEGTDIWALANKRISITPLQLDMTDHSLIAELKNWEIKT
jgi:5'-nucleotidase